MLKNSAKNDFYDEKTSFRAQVQSLRGAHPKVLIQKFTQF